MRERGILMSAPMVRATLEDRKLKTRRVFMVTGPMGKAYPVTSTDEEIQQWEDGSFHYLSTGALSGPYPCPYGVPGDRLWVRETFKAEPGDQVRPEGVGRDGLRYLADNAFRPIENSAEAASRWLALYCYGSTAKRRRRGASIRGIHMPRWACRLVLELTEVRVERLQDISDDDARAEGLEVFNFTGWGDEPGVPHVPEPDVYRGAKELDWEESPVVAFRALWDSINGDRPGCTWADNPWVWVLGFKRVPA